MKYILDTDTISFLYDQKSACYPPVFHRMTNCLDSDKLCVSVLSLFELEYSFYNSPASKRKNLRFMLDSIKKDFEILSLDQDLASKYGQLKSLLKQSRNIEPRNMKKHNIDLMIASVSIGESGVLVSNDQIYQTLSSLFPQLQVEDWTI